MCRFADFRRLPRHFAAIATWLAILVATNFAAGQSPDVVRLPAADTAETAADPSEFTAVRTTELASILERLDALEQKAAQPAAPAKKPQDGWIDVSEEKWTVKLGGHVQLDYVLWPHADPALPQGPAPPTPAKNYFEFRRLRLVADGAGYGVYDFRLQIDIEPENGDNVPTPVTDVKDAYFSMNDLPLIDRARIGNFFVPFSLEQVTNDTNNIFLERSIPTQGIFAADREVGTAFYAVSDDKNSTFSGGIFFDRISESLKERFDNNQGTRISGRLTHLPFYDESSGGRYLVHTGVGILYTDNFNDRVQFRARPQVHEGPFLIDSGSLPSDNFTVGNLELATVWGPLSVQSELFLCNVNLLSGENANLYGGYVYLSWFLTGENRIFERYGQHGAQFARNVPFSNFFVVPGGCGPGAWEFKVRTSYLGLKEVDAGQYNDLTVGFNWYWTERTRIMFDWIHPVTSPETLYGATQSDLIGMRFDVNW